MLANPNDMKSFCDTLHLVTLNQLYSSFNLQCVSYLLEMYVSYWQLVKLKKASSAMFLLYASK